MLCEKCGVNNATTHIRTIINGVVHEKHLCSHCAATESKYETKYETKDNNLAQILGNMFGNASQNSQSAITRCGCCGSTYEDIAESGRCGCPECYHSFYNQLLPYFKRVHGSTQHIGKRINVVNKKTETDTIDELRELLKQLINEENYEQAAVVRDKIKSLQEGK